MTNSGKVLVFGAYGNGNLGDEIQANSLARAVKAVDDTIEITAASFLSKSDFLFDFEGKATREQLMDPDFVNQFDLLIIGGGGLLAHPHDPLHHDKWVRSLRLPIALWGVGATNFYAPQAKALIKKSIFVSGRDQISVETLLQFDPRATHVIDPVLADPFLRQPFVEQEFHRRAWIVAGPRQPIHDEILSFIREDDLFIGFEPSEDSKIEDIFPDIQYVSTTDEFFAATRGCRILSMRYHGTILGILGGNPVISLARTKGRDLLEFLGLGDHGINHMDHLPRGWAQQNTLRTHRAINWHRSMSQTYMKQLIETYVLKATATPSARKA